MRATAAKRPSGTHRPDQKAAQPPVFLWVGLGLFVIGALILVASASSGSGMGDTPDFSATTLAGDPVKLSDYRGQVILLNFWATWCPPCRAEMPAIETAYEQYRDQGFVVLAINNSESPGQITPFVNAFSLRFPIVLDTQGLLQDSFGITGYPTSLFIGREGKVYATHVGMLSDAQLRQYVETGLAPVAG